MIFGSFIWERTGHLLRFITMCVCPILGLLRFVVQQTPLL